MKICPSCGAEYYSEESRGCSKCGIPVRVVPNYCETEDCIRSKKQHCFPEWVHHC